MRWTASSVAEVLGRSWPGPDREFSSVSTDTRTLEKGALYVALRGERFDGHAFLADASRAGAAGAVVERGREPSNGLPCFEVADTKAALRQLAAMRRRALAPSTDVVAVTGTSGKTATKDMIAAVLATRYRVHATEGNRNNQVGVPLTILATPDDAEAVVTEVAMNLPDEIARLAAVVEPDVAVITNVGPGHLEGLGSVERVLEEKLAIIAKARLAVVGTDPPALAARAHEFAPAVVVAGLEEPADVRPDDWAVGADGRATMTLGGTSVTLSAAGAHQAANAMLAVAVGDALGIERRDAARALATVQAMGGRSEFRRLHGFAILNDCYNANPTSFRAALQTFGPIRQGRRSVVVVGTMLELGASSREWHETLAREIAATDPDVIAAVGEFVPAFKALEPGLHSRLLVAADAEALGRELAGELEGGEAILLKASRGIALERVLKHLVP